ncbi:hypothetical protein HK099_000657 [Clydaea vesicula]|uniref:Potassium channel domain-containing protein n=1 Tax=Clydaea vesicula TaxID=447962 RepID=A0AAD5XWF3_9FUNG|nr:hypothetical protein HK099_000657 [Clydaea vesicula]
MEVGFGDNVPKTVLGKLATSIALLMSVFIVAFPVTIISSQYTQFLQLKCNECIFSTKKRCFIKNIFNARGITVRKTEDAETAVEAAANSRSMQYAITEWKLNFDTEKLHIALRIDDKETYKKFISLLADLQ